MAVEPRILYKCNHIIDSKELKYGKIELIRNTKNYPDSPTSNIKILRVDRVYKGDIEYTLNVHYTQKLSVNTLEWVDGADNTPKVGEKYNIECLYTIVTTAQYDIDDCPRCLGNAWYINIFNEGKIESYTGINKLVQDVVKALFTDRANDYGSTIKDLVSQNIYSETDLEVSISTIITECQEQIKTQQSEQLSNGCTLDDSEILNRLTITNMIFVREEMMCYVTIEINNLSGETIAFTFTT